METWRNITELALVGKNENKLKDYNIIICVMRNIKILYFSYHIAANKRGTSLLLSFRGFVDCP